MDQTEAVEAELRGRIARHPPDRFPIQHATACFHLGTVLTDDGQLAEAHELLRRADGLFAPHLPVEQAKVRNALGAAQRAAGRSTDAAESFRQAATVFDEHGQHAEAGAAWFNLGLVQRERGDPHAAHEAFTTARGHLDSTEAPTAAAGVARELAALSLERGELVAARSEAERSLELSRKSGDHAGVGYAANVLGLVELAAADADAAVTAFRTAAAAHPRTVRGEGHAVATANLALAHERRGEDASARFAARRSLAVPGVSGALREQARQVLERLGDPAGDLARVLEEELSERWPELVRAELGRWAECNADERSREADAWIRAQTSAEDPVARAALLVAGLLELPSEQLHVVVDALIDAWASGGREEREALRTQLSRAMVRFHVPQWERLSSVLEASARRHDDAGAWR